MRILLQALGVKGRIILKLHLRYTDHKDVEGIHLARDGNQWRHLVNKAMNTTS